jgi:hypothetical protein
MCSLTFLAPAPQSADPHPARGVATPLPPSPRWQHFRVAVSWAKLELWRHRPLASSLGPGDPWCARCGVDFPCEPYLDAEELLASHHGAPPRALRAVRAASRQLEGADSY